MMATNGSVRSGGDRKTLNLRLPHEVGARMDALAASFPVVSKHRLAVEALRLGIDSLSVNAGAVLLGISAAPAETAKPVESEAPPEAVADLRVRLVRAMAAGHSLRDISVSGGVSMDDLLRVLVSDGAPSQDRSADPTPAPATWQERVCGALRAAVLNNGGASIVVDAGDIARIAPDATRGISARAIGRAFAALSHGAPAFRLRVEHLGRAAGDALVKYRVTLANG